MKIFCQRLFFVLFLLTESVLLMGQTSFVRFQDDAENMFCLAAPGKSCFILTDFSDYEGVRIAAENLKSDLLAVTGQLPFSGYDLEHHLLEPLVIIGSITNSKWIKDLVKRRVLDESELAGCYEKYVIKVVDNPFPNIERAVVIAGSDQRGAIYGIYGLSEQIGISPWCYWADVPVKKNEQIYLMTGTHTNGEPMIKYRGIFINDEAPALSGWAHHTFGGFNHQFYEKLFELILRLKGNYLWPAMWGHAFYDDDPENGLLANKMGIIMGTSHHEPMGRAHAEWKKYGSGAWDYESNPSGLNLFWERGLQRMKNWEKVVTIGMRGDGDEPMSEQHNIRLLEKIVKQQRALISRVSHKDASETPQIWALYKEVQSYYDKGMRVPDDVTLLLCDDNWGNVRKLPSVEQRDRKGGYGMYYHFDYVGGPRSYKWLNVTQIQRVWEQMNLSYIHGVERLWIVNVGDLKPMEYPITFFLDMAWNPQRFNASNLIDHSVEFCRQQFGDGYAEESARLMDQYCKYNSRITPELLDWNTYSLTNYNEFATVVQDYRQLLLDALRIFYLLPIEYRDAFDQLILFPIQASANLYELYYAVARNHQAAQLQSAQCNEWADKARACYKRDSMLMHHYNNVIANGKWQHMMDQIHIGYTGWQQPDRQQIPLLFELDSDSIPNINSEKQLLFVENDGAVSIEGIHYSNCKQSENMRWVVIPNLGKTHSAITLLPISKQKLSVDDPNSYVEYNFELKSTGCGKIIFLLSPSLNFNGNTGLSYAVSVNGGAETIVNFNGVYDDRLHDQWVANRIIESVSLHEFPVPGHYTVRFRALNVGVVLQKLIIDMGGLKPSFLGPPESPLKISEVKN